RFVEERDDEGYVGGHETCGRADVWTCERTDALPFIRPHLHTPTRLRVDGGVPGVALDELAARLDGVAHEGREDAVGGGGVLDGDLLEDARLGVHRGGPELLRVHLAEALVALDRDAAAAAHLLDDGGEL